ncbi:MAG: 1-phosphofructokinase family hexose kinase [Candidatus Omnitrophica bacterium]|nr:1-phosphofructokinase family hexose kinase [Candidatus Omnitrophota bacterium]
MIKFKPILTVTLNPAIDKSAEIRHFCANTENRATKIITTAGGKGINVSRALASLGLKSICAGFAGGASGQNLLRSLLLEGLEHNFVFIQGETRVNLTVRDPKSGRLTRILEPGPVIDKKDLVSFRHKYQRLVKQSDWVVLSGRGIGGTPADFYRELVTLGRKAASKVIVDTSAGDLLAALKGKPYLVKVNREEAQSVLKSPLRNRLQLRNALKKLLSLGSQQVIITLGAQGAVATDGKIFCYAICPKVKVRNTIGLGDALTAGCVCALSQNSSFRDALAFGVAAGTANALASVPGELDRSQLGGILQKVIVKDF